MQICDLKIRVPVEIHALLQRRADANRRSMNGEVLLLLEETLGYRAEAMPRRGRRTRKVEGAAHEA